MSSSVKILAFSDVHGQRYLKMLISSIKSIWNELRDVRLVVAAGDFVDHADVGQFRAVYTQLEKLFEDKIVVAVPGNEEYDERLSAIIDIARDFVWLVDSRTTISVEGLSICIVGGRGILKRPTPWQLKNVPNIVERYSQLKSKLKNLLKECSNPKILVTHYATTFETVVGEPESIFDYLGYPLVEELNSVEKPLVAIHGHAHRSKVTHRLVNDVEVHNVALPANGGAKIVELRIDNKGIDRSGGIRGKTLLDFVRIKQQ